MTSPVKDAASLVELARDAVRRRFNEACAYLPYVSKRHAPFGLCIFGDGMLFLDYASSFNPTPLMFAPITPENVASEYALVRALLASAVTVRRCYGGDYMAIIDEEGTVGDRTHYGSTEAEAVNALLDALLAPKTCVHGKTTAHDTGFYEPGKPAHHGWPQVRCPGPLLGDEVTA